MALIMSRLARAWRYKMLSWEKLCSQPGPVAHRHRVCGSPLPKARSLTMVYQLHHQEFIMKLPCMTGVSVVSAPHLLAAALQ